MDWKENFIKKASERHKYKYDYSKVEYINVHTKVCIICPEHGEFLITPNNHLRGHGCPKCAGCNKSNNDTFVTMAKEIHGDKYDYSKVEYVNYETKVCIICPEHGEFWQTPHGHLNGQGCPYCKNSYLENEISILLKENKIIYEQEKTFEWLRDKGRLYLDFYLPDYNILIEYNGQQHFKISFGQDENKLIKQKEYGKIKNEWCIKNNITLIRIPYYKKFSNLEELLGGEENGAKKI